LASSGAGGHGPFSLSSFVLRGFALARPFDEPPSHQSLIRILLSFVFSLADPRLPQPTALRLAITNRYTLRHRRPLFFAVINSLHASPPP